jgi:alpha-tubulin suppressor-like RCC1 family protein
MPTQIYFGEGIQIIKVACGAAHTIALTITGEVFSWGFGDSGCLGLGPNISLSTSPKKLTFEVTGSDKELLEMN